MSEIPMALSTILREGRNNELSLLLYQPTFQEIAGIQMSEVDLATVHGVSLIVSLSYRCQPGSIAALKDAIHEAEPVALSPKGYVKASEFGESSDRHLGKAGDATSSWAGRAVGAGSDLIFRMHYLNGKETMDRSASDLFSRASRLSNACTHTE